jgi:hypothetical protein
MAVIPLCAKRESGASRLVFRSDRLREIDRHALMRLALSVKTLPRWIRSRRPGLAGDFP